MSYSVSGMEVGGNSGPFKSDIIMLRLNGVYCEVTKTERNEIERILATDIGYVREKIGSGLLASSVNQNQFCRRAKALYCLNLRCAGEDYESFMKKAKKNALPELR